MNFDYDRFKADLKAVTRKTFEQARDNRAAEEICGLSLYSDESAMSISLTINTAGHLRHQQAEDPQYATYFRWVPGEWKYEMVNIAAFKDLNNRLQNAVEEVEDGRWRKYRNRVYDSAVQALEELKKEGLFKNMSPDFVLMFAVSELAEKELETKWVARLNRQELVEDFSSWRETEED